MKWLWNSKILFWRGKKKSDFGSNNSGKCLCKTALRSPFHASLFYDFSFHEYLVEKSVMCAVTCDASHCRAIMWFLALKIRKTGKNPKTTNEEGKWMRIKIRKPNNSSISIILICLSLLKRHEGLLYWRHSM